MDFNQVKQFNFPTIIRFGAGAIKELAPYLKNHGFDSKLILDFIDMDSLFDYLIRSDGYGQILNRYDGRDDEYKVNGSWYHVMREN
jgi:hypothetical protein